MVENLDSKIQYGGAYGRVLRNDKYWNDGLILKDEIMNYKIIKIKIYYDSKTANKEENKKEKEDNDDEKEEEEKEEKEEEEEKEEKEEEKEEQKDEKAKCKETDMKKETKEKDEFIEEKYIVGICFVYKNLYTGEIKEIEHKGTNDIIGMKELNIKGNEYLKRFNINIKDDFDRISQLSFYTNRNKEISVGVKDGEDKMEELNNGDNVLIGSFGYLRENINALGCIYINKKVYIEKLLFGFFLLRKILKNNKEFLEKWNKEYKKLDKEFQYIWRVVNLPDFSFAKIIEFCFL